jgi:hypothetical protein
LTGDFDGAIAGALPLGTHLCHAAKSAGAIAGCGKIVKTAGAAGDSREHGVTVGDGFIAGNANYAMDAAGGADDGIGRGWHEGYMIKHPSAVRSQRSGQAYASIDENIFLSLHNFLLMAAALSIKLRMDLRLSHGIGHCTCNAPHPRQGL